MMTSIPVTFVKDTYSQIGRLAQSAQAYATKNKETIAKAALAVAGVTALAAGIYFASPYLAQYCDRTPPKPPKPPSPTPAAPPTQTTPSPTPAAPPAQTSLALVAAPSNSEQDLNSKPINNVLKFLQGEFGRLKANTPQHTELALIPSAEQIPSSPLKNPPGPPLSAPNYQHKLFNNELPFGNFCYTNETSSQAEPSFQQEISTPRLMDQVHEFLSIPLKYLQNAFSLPSHTPTLSPCPESLNESFTLENIQYPTGSSAQTQNASQNTNAFSSFVERTFSSIEQLPTYISNVARNLKNNFSLPSHTPTLSPRPESLNGDFTLEDIQYPTGTSTQTQNASQNTTAFSSFVERTFSSIENLSENFSFPEFLQENTRNTLNASTEWLKDHYKHITSIPSNAPTIEFAPLISKTAEAVLNNISKLSPTQIALAALSRII